MTTYNARIVTLRVNANIIREAIEAYRQGVLEELTEGRHRPYHNKIDTV